MALSVSFTRPAVAVRPVRVTRAAPVAAYGQDSKYFDLNVRTLRNTLPAVRDLENTVGAWDMYGQEDSKRYPGLQNEFFERAASGLTSRGSMLRLIAVFGAGALLTFGAKGARDANLPITKGPQTGGENGKGGKAGRL